MQAGGQRAWTLSPATRPLPAARFPVARMQRFLASGIVGDLNTKTGGGQIKTVLFKGWPALRLDSVRNGGARQQHDGHKQAQGPEAVDPK